jgi:hypothetical protein
LSTDTTAGLQYSVHSVVCLQTQLQGCTTVCIVFLSEYTTAGLHYSVHGVVCLQTQLQGCNTVCTVLFVCRHNCRILLDAHAISILQDFINGQVFWDLKPCRSVNSYRRFGETCVLHIQFFGGPRRFSSFLQQPFLKLACKPTWLSLCPRSLVNSSVRQVELNFPSFHEAQFLDWYDHRLPNNVLYH